MRRTTKIAALCLTVIGTMAVLFAPGASAATNAGHWTQVKYAKCDLDAKGIDPYCAYTLKPNVRCTNPIQVGCVNMAGIWAYSFKDKKWNMYKADTFLWTFDYGIDGWSWVWTQKDGFSVTKTKLVKDWVAIR